MRRPAAIALCLALLLLACTGRPASPPAARPTGTRSGSPTAPATPTPTTPTQTPEPVPATSYRKPVAGVALPDGFVPEVLAAGERPPQFVVVSFDGGGRHDMWDRWLALGERVPFRFTVFLSGVYLLSDRTRQAYDPPGYPPGTSDIGWRSARRLPVEIADVDRAVAAGSEIGTHFNGHFCSGTSDRPGGNSWSSAGWDAELTQFFRLLQGYRRNNPGQDLPTLAVTADDVLGDRTPCLEGRPSVLYPVLARHHLSYDSTFTRPGLSWPTRDPGTGIWRFGMYTFPIHGTLPDGRRRLPVTSMDYNYFYVQRREADASRADAARDSAQVLATYQDMYRTALDGDRAPLVLGNHFEDWNHGAYSDALERFVSQVCERPETRCVPFRDVVAWLQVQPPSVLAALDRPRG